MKNYNEEKAAANTFAYLFFTANCEIRKKCIEELKVIHASPIALDQIIKRYLIPIHSLILNDDNKGGYHFAFYDNDHNKLLGKLKYCLIKDLEIYFDSYALNIETLRSLMNIYCSV